MEFISPNPGATVRSVNVRATLDAFELLPELGVRLIQKHGLELEDLRPERFIPLQNWLNALKEIQQTVGPNKLRAVGRRVINNADFPPSFATAQSTLLALDEIYHLNHKGEVGRYQPRSIAGGAIEIRCETPYPQPFEWGLVEGICSHPRFAAFIYGRAPVESPPAPPVP